MMQPDFVETYLEIKKRYRIEDDELELEFTESIAVEELELMQKVLKQLKKAGSGKPGLSVRWMISERGIRP